MSTTAKSGKMFNMTKTPDQLVGTAIQDRRVRYGYTQGEFAQELRKRGVKWSQGTLSRVELGERPVRLVEATVVAEVLGVELPVLLREGATTEDKVRIAQAEFAESVVDIQRAVMTMTARMTDVEDLLKLSPDSFAALATTEREGPPNASEYLPWLLGFVKDIEFEEPVPFTAKEPGWEMLAIADYAVSHAIARITGPRDEDREHLRKPVIPSIPQIPIN